MYPMLCQHRTDAEGFSPEEWATEIKLDGWRLLAGKTDERIWLRAGRNGSDYTGQVPYVEAVLADVLPEDTIVDGELVATEGWGSVQGAMTRGIRHPINDLTLVVFDVLRLAGYAVDHLPWERRREVVEMIGNKFKGLSTSGTEMAVSTLLPTHPATLEAVIENGFEGLVLKRRSSRYVQARSSSWVAVKRQLTCEARVVGFKPGENGWVGLVGALEFELLDSGARSRCSGFDMATREDITAHPERWLNTIIEVKHHGILGSGKPKNPQFLRRRDDRSPREEVKQSPPPAKEGKPKMRNYKQMKDDKLLRSITELEEERGEAYDKCVGKGGDPTEDLVVARGVAEARGLTVSS